MKKSIYCDELVFLMNQNKTKNTVFIESFEFSSLAPVVMLVKLYFSLNKRSRLDGLNTIENV